MGRESIAMSDDELRAFLGGVRQVVVAVLGKGGEPLGALARRRPAVCSPGARPAGVLCDG